MIKQSRDTKREEGLAREKAISKRMAHPIRMQHVRNTEYGGMQDLSSVQRLQSADLRPVPHILVRLYKPVTTPITVMYYVCLHSERNSRKQRSENTLNLFTAWLLLGQWSELSSLPFGISSTSLLMPQSYPNARTDFQGFWNERSL